MVELLLTKGADVDYILDDGNSVLIGAIIMVKNNPDLLINLIKYSSDVNIENSFGITPLIAAAYVGKYSIMKELLTKNVNVNHVDSYGASPLSILIWRQNQEVKREIINSVVEEKPLDVEENNYLIKLILEHGADANSVRKEVNDYIEDEELRKLINSYM